MNAQNAACCEKCPRHCPLDAPGCPRGAQSGAPGAENAREAFAGAARRGQPPRGRHGEPPACHAEPPQERDGRGPHGHREMPPGEKAAEERRRRYEAMPVEGRLRENLRRLGHMLYHSADACGGQFRTMAILALHGPMAQRELGEMLDVRAGSLSELLGKLEAAGFIVRTTNPHDRRGTDVALTEAGRAASAAHEAQRAEKTRALFTSLTADEKQALNALLERLAEDWRGRIFPPEPLGEPPRGPQENRPHGQDGPGESGFPGERGEQQR